MNKAFKNTKHLHFVGIGGIGMSGMAELLHKHGFKISGSDINKTDRTTYLADTNKIKIYYSHNKDNIIDSDVIVYSSAINFDNPELKEGKRKNIPIIRRAELLGELLKIKEISVAVAGTHGKTSTSSILGSILHESKINPTLIIGGIVNKFGTNNISGDGDVIVVEADEFDKSFLALNPTYSIINNLDLEHLDCYKNLEDLQNTFKDFANAVPFYGKVAINIDNKNLNQIINKINRPKITYGTKSRCDVKASNIIYKKTNTTFTIDIKSTKQNFKVNLPSPGKHNVYNALGAIAIALELKIPLKTIIKGINSYTGVKRRFEIIYKNKKNNIMIVDDYAHHPTEILATIKAAKNGWGKRIIAIFQPHLFSRTNDFCDDFANALDLADIPIITEIFAAREKPIKGVSSNTIIKKMKNQHTFYIKEKNNIKNKIKDIININDTVIIMGAGNINSISDDIIKIAEQIK